MVLFGQEHVDRYRATDGEEGHEWLEGSTSSSPLMAAPLNPRLVPELTEDPVVLERS